MTSAARRSSQDQPPAEELRARHDVAVGDPPADGPVGLDRERLDLGLDEDVRQPRRPEDREQRRRRAVRPAELAGPRVEPVGMEAVLHDERPVVSHSSRRRLVVDRRREADRPRPGRRIDPELGPAERLRIVGPTERARSTQRAAGLGQGEDRGALAAAGPAPAGAEAARIADDACRGSADVPGSCVPATPRSTAASDPRVLGPCAGLAHRRTLAREHVGLAALLGDRARPSRWRASGASPAGPGRPPSAVPAAAQTIWNRPRSGSMTTRTGGRGRTAGCRRSTKPGQLVGLAGGRPPDVGLADDRGQPGQVDAVRARDEAHDRLERRRPSPGATKTSDFTIWPSSAPTARGRVLGGVRGLVEDVDVEGDALPGGGVEDPLDRPAMTRSRARPRV